MRATVDPVAQRDTPRSSAWDAASFKAEVRRWAAKIGVQPKRVQIQRMTTKWASCSPAGRICFNSELLLENAAFQEVVVVHELLHLLVPNHGKLFRSLMAAYVPGWEQVSGSRIARLCGHRPDALYEGRA